MGAGVRVMQEARAELETWQSFRLTQAIDPADV